MSKKKRSRSIKRQGGKEGSPPPQALPIPASPQPKRWIGPASFALALLALTAWFLAGKRDPSPAPQKGERIAAKNTGSTATFEALGLEPAVSNMEPRVAARVREAAAAVDADVLSARAWGTLGAVLDAHDVTAPSRTAYERARKLDPKEFRWAYNLAHAALAAGEPLETCRKLFEDASAIAPTYAPLWSQWGDALSSRGEYQQACEAHRRALAIDPSFAAAERGLGMALLALGESGQALESLLKAERLMPEDGKIQASLARAYTLQGDADAAAKADAASKSLKHQNRIPDAIRDEVDALGISAALCIQRGSALLDAGKPQEAIAQLEIAAEVQPGDPYVRYQLGLANMRTGKLEAAESHLRAALSSKPDFAEACVELGRILRARGERTESLALLQRAVSIDPKLGSAHAKLALALADLGLVPEANQSFERAEALGALDAEGFVNWGVILHGAGNSEEAKKKCERAIELDPKYAKAHYGLGFIEQALGDCERAVPHYVEATRLQHDLTSALENLARCCDELGRNGEALAAYRALIELVPAHPLLARLKELESLNAGSEGDWPSQKPEFEAIADRLFNSDQKYVGRKQRNTLAEQVQDLSRPVTERIDILGAFARECVELAELEEAERAIDQAFELCATVPGLGISAELHRLRGLVYLRKAEWENCVTRHNAQCCILPLAEGGLHTREEAARKARESYTNVLERNPDDLAARWILNLLALVLGEWPQAVESEMRMQIVPNVDEPERQVPRFTDIAKYAGLDAFNLAGGSCAGDFDGEGGDGKLDVLVSTSDPEGPLKLFKNRGDGTFEDVSAAWRADEQFGGLNTIAADYDSDGDLDAYVLRGGWLFDDGRIRKSLLRNDGGVFRDVTRQAGVAAAFPTQTAVFGDFDLDGDLDLYVGLESRVEFEEGGGGNYPSQLLLNDGKGVFTDVAATAGVTNDRYAKGVATGDYDNDGDLDLYVSNTGPNRLYRNDLRGKDGESGKLHFTDVAEEAGVTEPVGRSFATWFFDYDHDGWLDLWVGAFDATVADHAAERLGKPVRGHAPKLYRNRGDGRFDDVTHAVGLTRMFLPMGSNFGDIDGDGFLDIYLGTGDPEFESLMPNVMLRNVGGKRFVDVTSQSGLGHLQKGHGVAFADFDNDGDQDLFHQLGGFYPGDRYFNALFLNPLNPQSSEGKVHFVAVELSGRRSNRMGYGTRLRLVIQTQSGERREIHRAPGSVSSFGGSPPRQEIGLGAARAIELLEVTWPVSGEVQAFENPPMNSFLRVVEGSSELVRLDPPRFQFGDR